MKSPSFAPTFFFVFSIVSGEIFEGNRFFSTASILARIVIYSEHPNLGSKEFRTITDVLMSKDNSAALFPSSVRSVFKFISYNAYNV